MKFIIFLALLACSSLAKAQTAIAVAGNVTATATVKNPNTKTKTQTKTTKTSVSVSISDNSYSLHAVYDSFRRAKLQKLLMDNLDRNLLSTDDGKMIWKKENDNETAYIFTLTDEKLKVSLDRELVSASTFEKFKALGENISRLLNDN